LEPVSLYVRTDPNDETSSSFFHHSTAPTD
jgi:hypothetical protein